MLRYCGPFLFAASVPLLYYYGGPAGPFLTVAGLLAVLLGVEAFSPRGDAAFVPDNPRGFRALVILYIPLQLGLIGWASWAGVTATPLGLLALIFSVGVTTGVFGMLAAHEAVHSGDPFEGMLGTAMLTGMAYRHFRIAHVHGHHRWAATVRDPGTARLGEGFYHFLFRTIGAQFVMAFRFEESRCRVRRGHRNRIVEDLIVMVLLLAGIVFVTGGKGLLVFLGQSVVAVIILELFNYIAHYGLLRQENGRRQSLDDSHSWNSSNVLANSLIFNMGRHSFHHQRPAAPYQGLRRIAAAPELPAGYAGSILLALAPPLWRRVMDHRVRDLERA